MISKNNAKQLLPLIQALADGKTVQLRIGDIWRDWEAFDFESSSDRYRIKPEPVYRPWKPEEIPVGAMIRKELPVRNYVREGMITGRNGAWVETTLDDGKDSHTTIYLFNNGWQHSIDGGMTWKICGVISEE